MERKYVEPTEELKRFYADVRRLRTLTQEEEQALLKNLTPENRQIILNANQRYVIKIAKQFSTVPNVIMELVSEGNIGLAEAIDKWDPTQKVGFLTFSRHYIRRSMTEFFDDSVLIRQHKGIKRAQYLAAKFEEKFFGENGYYPNEEQTKDYLRNYKGFAYSEDWNIHEFVTVSADEGRNDDEDNELPAFSFVDPDNNIDNKIDEMSTTEMTTRLISNLNDMEKSVISMTFGLGTPEQPDSMIAERLQVTEKVVNKIRKKALWKMRYKSMKNINI